MFNDTRLGEFKIDKNDTYFILLYDKSKKVNEGKLPNALQEIIDRLLWFSFTCDK